MGVSQWANPQERALQLKRQQKVLREQECSARPEWEKRRMVFSLDVDAKGKARATRRFEREDKAVEGRDQGDGEDEGDGDEGAGGGGGEGRGTGQFARNPLLGGLIRPTFTPKVEKGTGKDREREKKSTWRVLQDDNDDNEDVILDGGAYGDRIDGRVLAAEEPACG